MLNDKQADKGTRDDAAMDLGSLFNDVAFNGLCQFCKDEDTILLASAGESLGEII